ncbi:MULTISPECIES: imidazole glycerol phosphate synthase subunit HisH [Muribaculaceae]|jgi:glutamine amidotransferase|uniref:Imidazole glycerol phosphate synthase subunit HisH n=2 Tax=Duncaniella TaxID=2518495 RepID=A0A4P7W4G8_9BACT|nr:MULTISPECIES: imidazole glycerol phosphate synthase subunit HisH [Muribaculaceae]MBJ2190772.1 imidazole glycerol phosphate synthase subunit HisH [Muribaculaceae bacterium]ROS84907.1 imidazole glycerol phosphate synthase subunit HisH [Muribaculaceae bacterium Isolate-080 (Janvier)]HBN62752.1 imidazole glycerol phosphate synthase subunit HisH [Porphyromonadaceae bacterium]MCX4285056.1 imidazole glycerol phosphate synthase subunit HisH [Duncaniella dubosii]MDE6122364.1 imidazole glycerol phosp
MIAVIDYEMGNLRSVGNALDRLGAEWKLTADHDEIRRASKVLLPGVGNDAEAMARLRDRDLCQLIRDLRRPVLGICVGMQVMCRHSEEGDVDCLGIFDAKVRRFPDEDGLKVPHVGWNRINNLDSKLLKGIERGAYVYYVHSYYAPLCPDTIATTRYGSTMFSAALKYENFYGTQFHPEKSGDVGEKILENFLAL